MQTDSPIVIKKRFVFQRHLRENLVKMIHCRKSALRSFSIDQELLEDQEIHRREIQLLLLGNKNSGRSTMVKQLRIHYGDSFPTSVRKHFTPFIIANLADAVIKVVQFMEGSKVEIKDTYVKEIVAQLMRNQPSEGYTAAVSFAIYSRATSFDTRTSNSSVEFRGIPYLIEDEKVTPNSARLSALSNFTAQTVSQVSTSPPHVSNSPLHIKLLKTLTLKEILSLLGSIHPEVDWVDVIQSQVFKEPEGSDLNELLANWLENTFQKGKLNPAKVMAALQEREFNPYIRKLPVEIAAQLPPPHEIPPSPPPTSAPDLDSHVLTESDEWSSNTSIPSEKLSLSAHEDSMHSDLQADEKPSMEEEEEQEQEYDKLNLPLRVATEDGGQSLGLPDFKKFNVLSLSGRMLKLIIDRSEFRKMLEGETSSQIKLSTSQLYFIENVDRFIQNDYTPTLRDILLVQMPCNAVRESLIQVGSTSLRLVNVGDQKGDRRKWIYLFETVHAVLFFASLIDFLEPSQFQEFETRIDESLEYFWFVLEALPLSKKDSILFLTKKDILPSALKNNKSKTPSNYPELGECSDPQNCISIQRDLYLSRCREKAGRVFTHAVCLLDIDEMKLNSQSVLKNVLDANFRRHAMF